MQHRKTKKKTWYLDEKSATHAKITPFNIPYEKNATYKPQSLQGIHPDDQLIHIFCCSNNSVNKK